MYAHWNKCYDVGTYYIISVNETKFKFVGKEHLVFILKYNIINVSAMCNWGSKSRSELWRELC